jgi:hypothetical protein
MTLPSGRLHFQCHDLGPMERGFSMSARSGLRRLHLTIAMKL